MSEVRLCASHSDYEKFAFMQRLLIIATNPQLFFDVKVDVAEPERLAIVEKIKNDIGKEIDDYQFLPSNIAEYINKLEKEMYDRGGKK